MKTKKNQACAIQAKLHKTDLRQSGLLPACHINLVAELGLKLEIWQNQFWSFGLWNSDFKKKNPNHYQN